MSILRVEPADSGLIGRVRIPGDKSISHRAAMVTAIAEGTSTIANYSNGVDCMSTLECFSRLGVPWRFEGEMLVVDGVGLDGLQEADDIMSAGNSGTTLRLMCGLLAGQSFLSVLTGDRSLRGRPMLRIVEPLRMMGARIFGRKDGREAPLAIVGSRLNGIEYTTPVASAQIKSSLLLAGLYADGETIIHEPHGSRDHTERMLAWFGADIKHEGNTVWIQGRPRLQAKQLLVPGDISAAAFYLAAAGLVPGSEIEITTVGVNPTRTGILDILSQMGLEIEHRNERLECGEPVADLVARHRSLVGVEIGGAIIPRCIDEIPVLAVLATQADGTTVIRDAAELRVKETDRLATVTQELRRLGANIEEKPDGLVIEGPVRLHGGRVSAHGDHRLAMALAVAALVSEEPVYIEGAEVAGISDPLFYEQLSALGAVCTELDEEALGDEL